MRRSNFGTGTRNYNIKTEKKYVDTAGGPINVPCTTGGSVTLLNGVTQGASQSQRIGRKVIWKSIQCHMRLLADNVHTFSIARYLLIWDRQPNAALPGIAAFFEGLAGGFAQDFPADAQKDRFLILRDKKFAMLGASVLGQMTDKTEYAINFYQRLPDFETVYGGATNAIADITSGALYLVTCGSGTGAGFTSNIVTNFRLRFIDP